MAAFYISAVHVVPGAGTTRHSHIGSVRLSDGRVLSRAAVISAIRLQAGRFFTNATPPASVYVHPCPYCGASDYITTHRDRTAANNLLHLPKF